MPLAPTEFFDYVRSFAGADGRLPLSRMTGWEVFPFEPEGLRVVPLDQPVLPEAARDGEGGVDCQACAKRDAGIWVHDRWRLSAFDESGAPLVLMLHSRQHFDLPTLSDELAAELGVLIVHIVRAVELLPHVARAHVSRWGDGGAHLHVFFFARPEGFAQLRGTCLAVWDDLLPAQPVDVVQADAKRVAEALAGSFGGASQT
jgi:hypothetical protein